MFHSSSKLCVYFFPAKSAVVTKKTSTGRENNRKKALTPHLKLGARAVRDFQGDHVI